MMSFFPKASKWFDFVILAQSYIKIQRKFLQISINVYIRSSFKKQRHCIIRIFLHSVLPYPFHLLCRLQANLKTVLVITEDISFHLKCLNSSNHAHSHPCSNCLLFAVSVIFFLISVVLRDLKKCDFFFLNNGSQSLPCMTGPQIFGNVSLWFVPDTLISWTNHGIVG